MNGKKYELLQGRTIERRGHTLYRIRALRDFGDVRAGDVGGWVESERNLSQDDDAWVYGNAMVCDNAKVCTKCSKCRLYCQHRCKGLLDYQRRYCPEWLTYGMIADAWGRRVQTRQLRRYDR